MYAMHITKLIKNIFAKLINEALKKADIPDNNLGYGLFNVNSRIKHQYGNEYGVILSAENHIFKSYMTQPGEMK